MFDIGFSELLVVAVVALLVLGPERLPKATRFAGLWVRRARAQWYSVKDELERELAADELKRSLKTAQDQLRDTEESLRNVGAQAQHSVDELNRSILDTGHASADTNADADPLVDETIATETSPAETLSADELGRGFEPPSSPSTDDVDATTRANPTPLPEVSSLAEPTLMPTNDAGEVQLAANTGAGAAAGAEDNASLDEASLENPQAASAQTASTEDSRHG